MHYGGRHRGIKWNLRQHCQNICTFYEIRMVVNRKLSRNERKLIKNIGYSRSLFSKKTSSGYKKCLYNNIEFLYNNIEFLDQLRFKEIIVELKKIIDIIHNNTISMYTVGGEKYLEAKNVFEGF